VFVYTENPESAELVYTRYAASSDFGIYKQSGFMEINFDKIFYFAIKAGQGEKRKYSLILGTED
jgi:hypothetical protein